MAFSKGISDNFDVLAIRQRFDLFKEQICSYNRSSIDAFHNDAGAATIPIVKGLIDGTHNDQTQLTISQVNAFCDQKAATSEQLDYLQSRSETINRHLVEAWKDCSLKYLDVYMAMNSLGVFVETMPYAEASRFEARVHVRNNRTGPVTIKSIGPTSTRCVSGLPEVPVVTGSTFDTKQFAMTCSKASDGTIPFSVTVDDGISNTVTVPSRASRLDELQSRIDAHSQQLTQSKTQLEVLARELANGKAIQAGVFTKTDAQSPKSVDFQIPFDDVPVVVLTPGFYNQVNHVTGIETVLSVSRTGFTFTSINAIDATDARKLMIQWVAVGKITAKDR